MKQYQDYNEAYRWAQAHADETRLCMGIEFFPPVSKMHDGYWLVRYLPGKKFRFGVDALCQAVEPT